MRRADPSHRRLTVAAACLTTLVAGVARADDAKSQAARSFRTGSDAYARRDFRAAARSFDDAYRIAPRGAAAYNGGLAWESAGDNRRAADDYTRALEASDLGTVERADATGRLRALERNLGELSFLAPSGAHLALDEADLPDLTATVHVEPGPHSVRVQYRDGRTETRTVVVQAGVEQSLRFGDTPEPPRVEPARSAPVDAPPEASAPREAARRPVVRDRAPAPPPDRTPAWIAFGGTAVASGVAIYLFEQGLSSLHAFEDSGSKSPALHTDATNYRTGTWVAWGVAGGLAVTGVILYLTAGRDTPAPAVVLDGHGATLRVRF